jgi:flagellar protein FlaG
MQMSNFDVKQVSNATGSFRALQPNSDVISPGGRLAPDAGKELPVSETEELDLGNLATKLNVASRTIGRDLRFRINLDSGQSVIQVLDRDTGEIIREIPPEKAQISVAINGDLHISLYDELA